MGIFILLYPEWKHSSCDSCITDAGNKKDEKRTNERMESDKMVYFGIFDGSGCD
jgi:hypothetical protein